MDVARFEGIRDGSLSVATWEDRSARGFDGDFEEWEMDMSQEFYKFHAPPRVIAGAPGPTYTISISPDGKTYARSTFGRSGVKVEVHGRTDAVFSFDQHIVSMCWSVAGDALYFTETLLQSKGLRVHKIDVATGENTILGTTREFGFDLAPLPSGNGLSFYTSIGTLCNFMFDGTSRLFEVNYEAKLVEIEPGRSVLTQIVGLAYSSNNLYLAAIVGSKEAIVFKRGHPVLRTKLSSTIYNIQLCWVEETLYVLDDCILRIQVDGTITKSEPVSIRAFSIYARATYVAVVSNNGTVDLYDPATLRKYSTVYLYEYGNCVDFSQTSRRFIYATRAGVVVDRVPPLPDDGMDALVAGVGGMRVRPDEMDDLAALVSGLGVGRGRKRRDEGEEEITRKAAFLG